LGDRVVGVTSFRQQKVFGLRESLKYVIPAAVGGLIGAQIAVGMDEETLRRVLGALMVVMVVLAMGGLTGCMYEKGDLKVANAGTPGFAREVRVHGRYALVAQGSGLTIFDLSDPGAPAPIATYEAGVEVSDVVVLGTAAYLATGAAGGVMVDLR